MPYFQVLNGKDKPVTIKLSNMKGIYRGKPHLIYTNYTQPVISTDQQKWDRISNIDYKEEKNEFAFFFTPSADTAWVAYVQPYPYGRLTSMMDTLKDRNHVSTKELGESVDGRPISMIKISKDDSSANEKKTSF